MDTHTQTVSFRITKIFRGSNASNLNKKDQKNFAHAHMQISFLKKRSPSVKGPITITIPIKQISIIRTTLSCCLPPSLLFSLPPSLLFSLETRMFLPSTPFFSLMADNDYSAVLEDGSTWCLACAKISGR